MTALRVACVGAGHCAAFHRDAWARIPRAARVGARDIDRTRAEALLPADTARGFGGDCVFDMQSRLVAGLLDEAEIENPTSNYLDVLRMEEAVCRSAAEARKVRLEYARQNGAAP